MQTLQAPRAATRRNARPRLGFWRVLLPVVLLGSGSPSAALEDPAERARIVTLENGLTVVSLEDHTTPVVSFQMWVKAGSKDETRYTGIAHLFEHMMFRGSKHIGPEEHAQRINARGGRLNAWTSNDFTVYFEDITSESLPLVIDLEHERVANLRIDQEVLDTEREVVLEERRLRTEDDPTGRGLEALFATLFTAQSYRWPVIGWRSDVARVTVEACRDFFETYYAPDNLVIVIVGDHESEATLEHLRRTFGRLPSRGEPPRSPTEEPPQRGPRRVDVRFDVRSPVLMAAWHAPPTGHEDGEALDVASQILSSGRSSRLYRKLVYEEQKALYAQGGYWEMLEAGMFFAYAGVRPGESIEEVEKLYFAEIARMRDEGVTEAELAKAKRQLEVGLVSGLGTAHGLAARFGRDVASFGRVRPLAERLDAYREVTAEDVTRVLQRYLVEEQLSVVRVVPDPEAQPGAQRAIAPGGEAS